MRLATIKILKKYIEKYMCIINYGHVSTQRLCMFTCLVYFKYSLNVLKIIKKWSFKKYIIIIIIIIILDSRYLR